MSDLGWLPPSASEEKRRKADELFDRWLHQVPHTDLSREIAKGVSSGISHTLGWAIWILYIWLAIDFAINHWELIAAFLASLQH